MPDIMRFHHFTLVCRDIQESLRFYTEVLGATIERHRRRNVGAPGGYGPIGIEIGNVTIDLFQADGDWKPFPGTYAQHYAFQIPWEAADAWFAHMKEHGVPLAIHPTSDRVISIYFTDPSGYHLELNMRSDSPEQIRREAQRLIDAYGSTYYWTDGVGLETAAR